MVSLRAPPFGIGKTRWISPLPNVFSPTSTPRPLSCNAAAKSSAELAVPRSTSTTIGTFGGNGSSGRTDEGRGALGAVRAPLGASMELAAAAAPPIAPSADDSSEQSSLLLAQSAVVPAGAAAARSGDGCCCYCCCCYYCYCC